MAGGTAARRVYVEEITAESAYRAHAVVVKPRHEEWRYEILRI